MPLKTYNLELTDDELSFLLKLLLHPVRPDDVEIEQGLKVKLLSLKEGRGQIGTNKK